MEHFFPINPQHLRFLVVADVDVHSAMLMAEHFVPQAPHFDVIVLLGPFTHQEAKTEEELAVCKGEIGAIIAQFENIVCRVIYLSSENDPVSTLTEQLHLTPNSVNIHARLLPLAENLFAIGFAETGDNLVSSGLPPDFDRSAESDDELDGVEVKAGLSSMTIIEGLLESAGSQNRGRGSLETGVFQNSGGSGDGACDGTVFEDTVEASLGLGLEGSKTASSSKPPADDMGIFIFNYKFAHTLNHFLFHMPEAVAAAGIKLCILPPSSDSGEPARLPKAFGQLSIAALGSLRRTRSYTVVDLVRREEKAGGWVQTIETRTLEPHQWLGLG